MVKNVDQDSYIGVGSGGPLVSERIKNVGREPVNLADSDTWIYGIGVRDTEISNLDLRAADKVSRRDNWIKTEVIKGGLCKRAEHAKGSAHHSGQKYSSKLTCHGSPCGGYIEAHRK